MVTFIKPTKLDIAIGQKSFTEALGQHKNSLNKKELLCKNGTKKMLSFNKLFFLFFVFFNQRSGIIARNCFG